MLIALDLDGTLLNANKKIDSIEYQWLIKYLKSDGILVFITCRNYTDMWKVIEPIYSYNKENIYISYDDGYNIIFPNGKAVQTETIDINDSKSIVRKIQYISNIFSIFTDDGCYDLYVNILNYFFVRLKRKFLGLKNDRVILFKRFLQTNKKRIWKIKIILKVNYIDAIYKDMCLILPNYCVTNNERVIEIMNGSSGKLGALMLICEKENIPLEQVIYIGDEGNDVYCMDKTNSFAMGNAPSWVKKHAKHITLDNNNHGVLKALQEIV